jgi:ATP-dependent DNA helicase RecG
MQGQQADRGLLDYSALAVADARWDDLDPLEFERFRRFIRESQGRGDSSLAELGNVELAKALGAVQANHEVSAVRVLGLLLFGREDALRRRLPVHEVAFQVLSGQKVEVNDFFRWPLLRVFDELLARFRARNREEELLVGMLRVAVPDYAQAAFREGVANALIHRDYTRLGAVHVQWHEDRIEIANPGGFPQGVRLDNLLVTQPRPRNPLLADAFKRAGVVERTARGVDTIFYEQLRNGRPAPNYGRSDESCVVLVLPGG